MKRIIFITLALLVGVATNPLYAQKKGNKTVCFKSNMDCTNCEKTVYEYLKFEKGVKDLKVDHASNTIMVEYKEGKTTDKDLAKAVEKKGYKADKISIEDYNKLVGTEKEEKHDHKQKEHKK
ncbi:MAG: cation transporter [Bacteroidota bacterium]